jgi:hypothetical protein
MVPLRHSMMAEGAAQSSGARSCLHLSLQLVHLCLDHQVNRFMGCDYNIETSLAQLKTTMPMELLDCIGWSHTSRSVGPRASRS